MSTMSPELALIDPELRADAVASLPPIYVNAFLEVRPRVLPQPSERRASSTRTSAALAYLLVAVVRTLVFEAVVFAAVFAVVLLANLFA